MINRTPKRVILGQNTDRLIMGVYAKKHLTIYEIPKHTKNTKRK